MADGRHFQKLVGLDLLALSDWGPDIQDNFLRSCETVEDVESKAKETRNNILDLLFGHARTFLKKYTEICAAKDNINIALGSIPEGSRDDVLIQEKLQQTLGKMREHPLLVGVQDFLSDMPFNESAVVAESLRSFMANQRKQFTNTDAFFQDLDKFVNKRFKNAIKRRFKNPTPWEIEAAVGIQGVFRRVLLGKQQVDRQGSTSPHSSASTKAAAMSPISSSSSFSDRFDDWGEMGDDDIVAAEKIDAKVRAERIASGLASSDLHGPATETMPDVHMAVAASAMPPLISTYASNESKQAPAEASARSHFTPPTRSIWHWENWRGDRNVGDADEEHNDTAGVAQENGAASFDADDFIKQYLGNHKTINQNQFTSLLSKFCQIYDSDGRVDISQAVKRGHGNIVIKGGGRIASSIHGSTSELKRGQVQKKLQMMYTLLNPQDGRRNPSGRRATNRRKTFQQYAKFLPNNKGL